MTLRYARVRPISSNRHHWNASERKRAADTKGIILCTMTGAAFIGCLFGAYAVDHANGVSVDASLSSAGIGARNGRWQIVDTDSTGNVWIVDHDLTLRDCMTLAIARNESERGRFQCERA